MSYRLYGGRYTRALIVQMVLAEAGIEYERHEVDILAAENRGPSFLALNLHGQLPVLVTPEGEVLTETPAINLYLIERHRLVQLAPAADEAGRGPFPSRLFFISDELEPIMKRYFYPPRYVVRAQDEAAMRELSLRQAFERLSLIDRGLRQRGPQQLGHRFSLLDIMLCFWLEYVNFDDRLAPYPGLLHSRERLTQRPLLQPFFERLKQWCSDYTRLQAAGVGAK